MISVEHLMEIQERLHDGENIDDVFNDVYELGRADAERELQGLKDLGKLYSEIRADAFDEIHTELITEIALLNETDMTDVDLYAFAVRIKEITDKLVMK